MARGGPLYPGYYPGSPIIRRPGGGGKRPRYPTEYSPTASDEFFEFLVNKTPVGIPKWLWQQELTQMQEDLLAIYFGPQIESKGIKEYGEEEAEDLPGPTGGVMVNLNPLDWAKDPGKEARRILTKPIRAIIDYDDFKQRAKRDVWNEYFINDERSPFYLGGEGFEVDGKNVYNDVAIRAPKFMGYSDSIFSRNNFYGKYNEAVLKGLGQELAHKREWGEFDHTPYGEAIDRFVAKASAAESAVLIGDSLRFANKEFNKNFFSVKGGDRTNKVVANLWGKVNSAESRIKRVKSFGNEKDIAHVRAYEKYVNNLKRKLEMHTEVLDGKRVIRAGSEGAVGVVLGSAGRSLFRISADGGVGGRYLRGVVSHDLRNTESDLNEAIHSAKNASGEYVVSKSGRRMGILSHSLHRDYEWQTISDLAGSISRGKMPRTYIWRNVLRPRMERITPSYWMGRALKRAHHFGLLADNTVIGTTPKGFARLLSDNKIKIEGVGYALGGKDVKGALSAGERLLQAGVDIDPVHMLNTYSSGPSSLGSFKNTKRWLFKNKDTLGLKFDSEGLLVSGGKVGKENRKKLFNIFKGLEERQGAAAKGLAIDPTWAKAGLMQRYGVFLARVQSKTISKVASALIKPVATIQQKLFVAFGKLLEKAFGVATEGVGTVVLWVMKVLFATMLKKAGAYVSKAFRALKKLDFNLAEDLLMDTVQLIIKAVIGFAVVMLIPVVLGVMFFGAILSVFNSFDSTSVGGNVVGEGTVQGISTSDISTP